MCDSFIPKRYEYLVEHSSGGDIISASLKIDNWLL